MFGIGNFAMLAPVPLFVTGAGGRLGQLLHQLWQRTDIAEFQSIWQSRNPLQPDGLRWDILADFYDGPSLQGGIVLNLAGVTGGLHNLLSLNANLALAACRLAQAQGAAHVFIISSAAIYGVGDGSDLAEDAQPQPLNPYGRAKLEMERQVAEWQASVGATPGVTILRIGNVLGADSLIGGAKAGAEVTLDPVPGQPGGPIRSYIGPHSLAQVLLALCHRAARGEPMPPILNIAASPPVAMADLLTAAGIKWHFGPANPDVVNRVVLDTHRLAGLAPLPPDAGSAAHLVAEWRSLAGDAA